MAVSGYNMIQVSKGQAGKYNTGTRKIPFDAFITISWRARKEKSMRIGMPARAFLLAAFGGLLICGCSGRAALSGFDPDQSSIYIKKDGSVSSASVEQTEQNYYSQEDLEVFVSERVEEFKAGQDAQESAPISVSSCTVEEGGGGQILKCILNYDSPETLMAFNQAIRNPEIAFADLTTDTVSAMAQEGDFSQAVFTDAKGSSADLSKVTEKGDNRAVRVEGAGRIQTEGKILYTTEGCTLDGESVVQTPEDGVSYIIFQ